MFSFSKEAAFVARVVAAKTGDTPAAKAAAVTSATRRETWAALTLLRQSPSSKAAESAEKDDCWRFLFILEEQETNSGAVEKLLEKETNVDRRRR